VAGVMAGSRGAVARPGRRPIIGPLKFVSQSKTPSKLLPAFTLCCYAIVEARRKRPSVLCTAGDGGVYPKNPIWRYPLMRLPPGYLLEEPETSLSAFSLDGDRGSK
jgi:hypothetical protein